MVGRHDGREACVRYRIACVRYRIATGLTHTTSKEPGCDPQLVGRPCTHGVVRCPNAMTTCGSGTEGPLGRAVLAACTCTCSQHYTPPNRPTSTISTALPSFTFVAQRRGSRTPTSSQDAHEVPGRPRAPRTRTSSRAPGPLGRAHPIATPASCRWWRHQPLPTRDDQPHHGQQPHDQQPSQGYDGHLWPQSSSHPPVMISVAS